MNASTQFNGSVMKSLDKSSELNSQRVARQQQVMHAKGYAAVCADQSSALPIYASSIAEHEQKLHLQLVS
jgi:hypothetical protein